MASTYAIDPPSKSVPHAPPAVMHKELSANPPVNEPEKKQEVVTVSAYAGIKLSPIPEELSLHLGIAQSEGSLVRLVAPNSPAQAAGIEAFDIIQTFGGKKIQGHNCMCAVLKQRKVGEILELSLLRRGEKINRTITLGSRPEGLAIEEYSKECENPHQEMLRNVPERFAPQIRKLLEQNLHALGDADPQSSHQKQIEEMLQLRQQAENKMNQMLGMRQGMDGWDLLNRSLQLQPQLGGKMQMAMKSRISSMDENGRIEFNRHGDSTEAKVFDPQGKLEWSGPFSNDEDKKKVPADILKRLEKLNIQSNGVDGAMGNSMQLHLQSDE